ncbi:hypothetical protein N7481_004919 [Penicillium waksmanii]|uniref:uncharacterized protein n=1 Tax=Penicillium waksmanii TaxID=69791 RepID=UPI002548ECF7|nr:uncharacterized protein N7481_004919 [Penicillium waksmanii]KAJ5989709.1 hypothetical protein N7481_004919 [Penicillium waksmanii]
MASASVQQLLAALTIYILYYDKVYNILVDWIADQPFIYNTHLLIARVRSTQRINNVYSTKKKPVTFSP